MAHSGFSYDILTFGRNERLPEKFISSELHPIESKGMNCLMVTSIEIDNPWHHAREFGQQIVATLVREFVRSQSASTLIRFEQSLKLANHTINQASEKLGGQINCAVALFIEGEVHFAVIGSNRLLLFRTDRMTDVTSGDGPIATQFSTVTSGDLAAGEWVIVANQSLAAFSKKVESTLWNEDDIGALSAEIIGQAPPLDRIEFSGILIRYRDDPHGQEQTVLWDELDHVTPIKLPRLNIPKLNTAPTLSFIKKIGQKGWSLASALIIRARKSVPKRDASHTEKEPISERIGSRFKLPKLKFSPRLIALGVAALLIVGLAWGTYRHFAKSEPTAKVATILEELTAIPVGQRAGFITEKFDFQKYSDLSSDDKAAFSQALLQDGIRTYEPNNLVNEIPSNVVAIDAFGDSLSIIDEIGQLWQIKDGNSVKVEQALQVSQPVSVAMLSAERTVVSDKSGNVWLFDGSASQPTAIALPTSLTGGIKLLEKFGKSLYLYHADSKVLYRQTDFDKELGAIKVVLKAGIITEPLLDMAINGQVLVGAPTGMVTYFQAGKKISEASLGHSSETIRLTTVDNVKSLYAITGAFIVSSDTTLATKDTMFPLTSHKPTDVALDATGKTLWLAVGKSIYRSTL